MDVGGGNNQAEDKHLFRRTGRLRHYVYPHAGHVLVFAQAAGLAEGSFVMKQLPNFSAERMAGPEWPSWFGSGGKASHRSPPR